eukprot:4341393-Amphidinium_carterae.1
MSYVWVVSVQGVLLLFVATSSCSWVLAYRRGPECEKVVVERCACACIRVCAKCVAFVGCCQRQQLCRSEFHSHFGSTAIEVDRNRRCSHFTHQAEVMKFGDAGSHIKRYDEVVRAVEAAKALNSCFAF